MEEGNDFTLTSKSEPERSPEVEVVASYEKRPSMFDVIGLEKHEQRDAKGKLVGGCGHRWVDRKIDKFNYFEKTQNEKYVPATYDDIKVPFAEDRKKGEPWVLKNGSEEMVLMKRSVEENDKTLRRNRAQMQGAIQESSTFRQKIPGTNSSFTFQSSRSPVSTGPRIRTGF